MTLRMPALGDQAPEPALRTVRVGLLGCGIVGGGVADRLLRSRELGGIRFALDRVLVRDLRKERFPPDVREHLTASPDDVVADDVDVVVEAIGGTDIAAALVERALRRGKHVVTANKALIAEHGSRLAALAQAHGVALLSEAAVAGAIPVLRAIRASLAAETIVEIAGVLNGTSNYILNDMASGLTLDDALADAQRLGYAEADFSADVDGIDAARKLSILAASAWGVEIVPSRFFCAGIRNLEPEDFALARHLGLSLRLVAVARRAGDGFEAAVTPAYVQRQHEFAVLDGPFNAVRVIGAHSGTLTFSGPGAGREATASAIIGDLVEIARSITADRVPESAMPLTAHVHVAPLRAEMLIRVRGELDAARAALRAHGVPARPLKAENALRTDPIAIDAFGAGPLHAVAAAHIASVYPLVAPGESVIGPSGV